jgi:hypothetical protein
MRLAPRLMDHPLFTFRTKPWFLGRGSTAWMKARIFAGVILANTNPLAFCFLNWHDSYSIGTSRWPRRWNDYVSCGNSQFAFFELIFELIFGNCDWLFHSISLPSPGWLSTRRMGGSPFWSNVTEEIPGRHSEAEQAITTLETNIQKQKQAIATL